METIKKLKREKLEALVLAQAKIDELEFDEMFEFLASQIVKTLKIKRCSIFRVFPELEIACLVAGEPKEGQGMSLSFKDLGVLEEVVENKSHLIAEPRQDKRIQDNGLIYYKGVKAILLIPLLARDEVIGVIVAATGRKGFSQGDLYFCLTLSNLVRLRLERDLINQEKEEKKTLMILGQAVAEVAHRMRNPLVPLGGFAKRLAKKIQDPKYKKYAEIIVQEVEKLESILNGLLRFSRPKKVKLILTDINEIIKEAKQITVEGLIKERKIEVRLKLDPEIPLLLIDPTEIRGVFLDILRNAVEAIEKEGIISIQSKKEKEQVKISVSNTGCIDEEIINHIVDPFFTTKPGGSGLGLASVVNAIEAYGGELKVKNNLPAKQTTFIIKIPYSQNNKSS
jgi:hypothetical protein